MANDSGYCCFISKETRHWRKIVPPRIGLSSFAHLFYNSKFAPFRYRVDKEIRFFFEIGYLKRVSSAIQMTEMFPVGINFVSLRDHAEDEDDGDELLSCWKRLITKQGLKRVEKGVHIVTR